MKTIKQEVLEEFIKSDWKKWERELGKIGTLPKKRFFDREQENWKEAVDFIVDCTIKKLTEQHEKEIQKIKENETKINFLWDENKVILSRGKESRILKIKEPKKWKRKLKNPRREKRFRKKNEYKNRI